MDFQLIHDMVLSAIAILFLFGSIGGVVCLIFCFKQDAKRRNECYRKELELKQMQIDYYKTQTEKGTF